MTYDEIDNLLETILFDNKAREIYGEFAYLNFPHKLIGEIEE